MVDNFAPQMLHGETPGESFSCADTELDAMAPAYRSSTYSVCRLVARACVAANAVFVLPPFPISRLATALANPRTLIHMLSSLRLRDHHDSGLFNSVVKSQHAPGSQVPISRSKRL